MKQAMRALSVFSLSLVLAQPSAWAQQPVPPGSAPGASVLGTRGAGAT